MKNFSKAIITSTVAMFLASAAFASSHGKGYGHEAYNGKMSEEMQKMQNEYMDTFKGIFMRNFEEKPLSVDEVKKVYEAQSKMQEHMKEAHKDMPKDKMMRPSLDVSSISEKDGMIVVVMEDSDKTVKKEIKIDPKNPDMSLFHGGKMMGMGHGMMKGGMMKDGMMKDSMMKDGMDKDKDHKMHKKQD